MARAASTKKQGQAKRGAARAAAARTLRANARPEAVSAPEPVLDENPSRDIAGVLVAVFALASLIAVITPASAPIARALSDFYHVGFGLGGYVLPFGLLAVSALLFLRDRAPVPLRTGTGLALVFLAVLGILALLEPGTDSAVLFEPASLARGGGIVGAGIASVLQNALGTAISLVVLLGVAVLGLVITGLSISQIARGIAERASELAAKRRIAVNDRPWGDDIVFGSEDTPQAGGAPESPQSSRRAAAKRGQQSLFDDAGSAETTFLGNRETMILPTDEPDDPHENPLVNGNEREASSETKTRLIPVEDRFSPAGAGSADDAAGADGALGDVPRKAAGTRRRALDAIVKAKDRLSHDAPGEEPAYAFADDVPWDEPLSEAADTDDGASEPSSVPSATNSGAAASSASSTTPAAEDVPAGVEPRVSSTAASAGDGAASAKRAAAVAPEAASPAAPTVIDASTGEQRPIPSFLRGVTPASVPAAASDGEDEDAPKRELPPASMLRHNPKSARPASSSKELEQTANGLQTTLQTFKLHAAVVGWIAGPTVTTFKVQPGEGERVSRISSLEDDIALTLATDSVRIFAPIPGTSLVGIEIPNRTRQTVDFGDILPYVKGGPLEFALGRDAEGAPMVADLAKMPHLLIAGTTGSGKSVVISSIVMSLLMRTFPEDVRLIMIDPKRVEFAPYDGLPHLYVPVVTEPKQAASALQWAVSEMERRLKIFERIGVRKISTFNEKQAAGEFEKYDNPPAKMPYLVIVIDELSDLMMVAGKDVEASIVRIAQLGRAAGIHMIVATQRPSSNVVTGLIKANITNRIGLTVATGIDSRVILDQTGAEKLTGQGDMLFSRVDWGKPKRIQGCFVSDEEIASVVDFVKEHSQAEYHEEILSAVAPAPAGSGGGFGAPAQNEPAEDDPLLWDAARIVVDSQLGSTSGLQRRLKVGYARAGRIMDMLEEKGIVGPPDGSKPREVLLDMEALKALEAIESPLTEEELRGDL